MLNGHILITGISGMIGGKIAEYILNSDDYKKGGFKITGITRNIENAKKVLGDVALNIGLIEGDITNEIFMGQIKDVDYIFHCAAVTSSKDMLNCPVEVSDGIVIGTRNVLDVAKRCNVKGMIYLSSMEVYGVVEDSIKPRMEEELGDIDLYAARSCYPMAKRMAEHYCYIYNNEYGVPVKVARLAQVFGKGVRNSDNRVYMQFARSVIEGKDIVLNTKGESIGNYCDIEDAMGAIFLILNSGVSGEVYNVVNEENTMSIRDMAMFVADNIAKGNISVRIEEIDNSKTGYAKDTRLRLSSEKLRGLGWCPTGTLEKMYEDVIKTLNR